MYSGETKVVVGCDLVHISRFVKTLERTPSVREKLFVLEEMSTECTMEHLAGIFAAKEALIKALSWKAGCWHDIIVHKRDDGRPVYRLVTGQSNILSHDLSISHDGDYALAFCSLTLKQ